VDKNIRKRVKKRRFGDDEEIGERG